MPALTIEWRGTREELFNRLRQLPAVLAGSVPDPNGAAEGLLRSVGLTLLGKIQEAYDQKSQGGTDAMGVKWPPLAAATLALRNKNAGPKALEKIRSDFAKLPRERQRQIKIHYARLRDLYQSGNGTGAAARKHARSLLLRMQRFISPVLRDTDIMFNSLSPRIDSPDRILRLVPGAVSVGSNVRQFKYHQSRRPRKLKADGTPRLPRRQILPDDVTPIPDDWQRAVTDTVKDGLRGREFWQRFLGSQATVT
jgi:hypothetical protein